MTVLVIDGQGGKLGAGLVAAIRESKPQTSVIAVGTNITATTAMLKAGAEQGATGENPVLVACRKADYILGPIGIVAADALLGEITPAMAAAVGASSAKKILIPMNRCGIRVAGVQEMSMGDYIAQAIKEMDE